MCSMPRWLKAVLLFLYTGCSSDNNAMGKVTFVRE